MKNKYRNTAFLFELLINVLVFTIVCAVLLSVLSKAKIMTQHTSNVTRASNEAFAVFEELRAGGVEALAYAKQEDDGTFVLQYDSNWKITENDSAVYRINLSINEEELSAGILENAIATAYDINSNDELVKLETSIYKPVK